VGVLAETPTYDWKLQLFCATAKRSEELAVRALPAVKFCRPICRKRSDQLLWCHILVTNAPAHELRGT
jgi:hypothetical protein